MKAGTSARVFLAAAVGSFCPLPLFLLQRGLDHTPRPVMRTQGTTTPGSPELQKLFGVDPRELLLYDHHEGRTPGELQREISHERLLNLER